MKFAIFALTGLLVLGLCAASGSPSEKSAYSYGEESTTYPYNDDQQHQHGSNDDNDSNEGVPSLLDVIKSNVSGFFGHLSQAGKNFVSTLGNVKNTIVGKVTDLYNRLHQKLSGGNDEKQQFELESRYLQRLPKSYNAEELTGSFLLSELQFSHVFARNFNFNESKLVVDYKSQKGTLYLYSNRLTVTGKYSKNNFAAENSGNFRIELYDRVSYVENFDFNRKKQSSGDYTYEIYSYQTPHIDYGKMDKMYENIGFVSKTMESPISEKLLEQLAKKMSVDIHKYLGPIINEKIEHYAHCGPIEQAIRQLVSQTVQELHNEWTTNGNYQVELPASSQYNQEITSGSYVAIMSNMYLNGLEKFQVENVNARMKNGKFGFRVQLGVNQVQGSLVVSIKNAEKENQSVQKLYAPFTVDEIHAYLDFAKNTDDNQSAFEPRAVHVKVVNAKYVVDYNKYEEPAKSIIQGELQSYLQHTVSSRLQSHIEEALTAYLYRGVPQPQ